MPLSLRDLQKYFLIGSNTVLNIVTPLAILDHVAGYFNVDEGAGQHQENTRGVIVGLYAALVLGMEWRSARRMTEEVMAPPEQQQDNPAEDADQKSSGWHSGALAFDSWYKTIGRGLATAMVVSKLEGGTIAGTITGCVLAIGGYLHARNPGVRPNDIIHQVSRPGQRTWDWRGLMSALVWAGIVASAVDNSGRYITAYKVAAHEIVSAFDESDAEPYLNDDTLFLAVACLSSAATIYSKFLLARNRSADIWNKHTAAETWQEQLRLIDGWAVLGAAAHSVLAYCNDRFLTQKPIVAQAKEMPDALSLTASVLLPSLGFLGTYATNADYRVPAAGDVYQPLSPGERKSASANAQLLGSPTQSSAPSSSEKKGTSANTQLLGSLTPSSSSSPSKRKPTPVSPQLSVSITTRRRRSSSDLVYEANRAVIRGEGAAPVAVAITPKAKAIQNLRAQAARDVLLASNGESSDNNHSPSPPSPTSPSQASQLGRTQPAAASTSSWLGSMQEASNANFPYPDITVPLLPPAAGLPSARRVQAGHGVYEELTAGRSNANHPRPPAQVTVSPSPVTPPLSPAIERSPTTAEAKTRTGGWLGWFWERDEQPASSTQLLVVSPSQPEDQAVTPPEEDTEQNGDKWSCSIQ